MMLKIDNQKEIRTRQKDIYALTWRIMTESLKSIIVLRRVYDHKEVNFTKVTGDRDIQGLQLMTLPSRSKSR